MGFLWKGDGTNPMTYFFPAQAEVELKIKWKLNSVECNVLFGYLCQFRQLDDVGVFGLVK